MCASVYERQSDCSWRFVVDCPGYLPLAAGRSDGGDASAVDAVTDDATQSEGAAGGPGCPALENPDCTLALAASCIGCCGCQDIYVCVGGGWNLWGSCGDAGLVAAP